MDSLHLCRKKKQIVKDENDINIDHDNCADSIVPTNFDCLRTIMRTYGKSCGVFNDYSRKFIKFLVRECE